MLPYLASPERGCRHQAWRFWGGSKPFTCLASSTWLRGTSWMVWKLIGATKNIIFMLIVFKMSSSYWSFTSRRASSFRGSFSSLALLFDLERFQLLLERGAPAPLWVCHRLVPQSLSPSSSPVEGGGGDESWWWGVVAHCYAIFLCSLNVEMYSIVGQLTISNLTHHLNLESGVSLKRAFKMQFRNAYFRSKVMAKT